MGSVEEAKAAKEMLNGHNIYKNCCTLAIRYGITDSITVKVPSDKAVDFTIRILFVLFIVFSPN